MTTPAVIKGLSRNVGARTIVSWLGTKYIRVVDKTSSWTFERERASEKILDNGMPFIACFWHGRLMMMGTNWSRRHPLYMLISGHPDGKLIACIIQRLGFFTLEGSSKKGGTEAMRKMLRTLKSGGCIGITPDGPHGPRMRASLGAIALARLSGAPILPTTFSSTRRKVFKSWDKFTLARMFGKGIFIWGDPIWVPKEADDIEMERLRQVLENSLNNLTLRADNHCGHPTMDPAPIDNTRDTAPDDIAEIVS